MKVADGEEGPVVPVVVHRRERIREPGPTRRRDLSERRIAPAEFGTRCPIGRGDRSRKTIPVQRRDRGDEHDVDLVGMMPAIVGDLVDRRLKTRPLARIRQAQARSLDHVVDGRVVVPVEKNETVPGDRNMRHRCGVEAEVKKVVLEVGHRDDRVGAIREPRVDGREIGRGVGPEAVAPRPLRENAIVEGLQLIVGLTSHGHDGDEENEADGDQDGSRPPGQARCRRLETSRTGSFAFRRSHRIPRIRVRSMGSFDTAGKSTGLRSALPLSSRVRCTAPLGAAATRGGSGMLDRPVPRNRTGQVDHGRLQEAADVRIPTGSQAPTVWGQKAVQNRSKVDLSGGLRQGLSRARTIATQRLGAVEFLVGCLQQGGVRPWISQCDRRRADRDRDDLEG